LEEKIRALISDPNREFSRDYGVPGLHAEVRAANVALHKLTNKGMKLEDMTDAVLETIPIATHRVTSYGDPGTQFKACPNCTHILDAFQILTGVTE